MDDSTTSLQILPSQSISSLSSCDTDTSKSNQDVAEDMAVAFSKYVNFSVDKEENKFNESVEMMLTKLDEFFSLVDMVRSDTTLCLSTTMPDILAKCDEMEAIFNRIDKLEEFVNTVKDNVSAMEAKVVAAEADLGSVGGLVKKLTSFVSMKKTRPKSTSYVAPKIFNTSQYFEHSEEQIAESSVSRSSSSSSIPRTPSVPDDMMDTSDLIDRIHAS